MPGMLMTQTEGGRRLSPKSVDRILAQAHEEGARVRVSTVTAQAGAELTGVILGWRGPVLALRLERADSKTCAIPASCTLGVRMEIGGLTYHFETRLARLANEAEPGIVHLERPETVTLLDRRRSPRRCLRTPTEVVLCATGEGETWRCSAAMLNVSPDGIACRVPEQDVRALTVGQTLNVRFCLDSSSTGFDLSGRITNITQGGTPHHAVVGLAFIADDRMKADQARLRESFGDVTDTWELRCDL